MPLLTEKLGPACKPCGESHIVCSVDCVARNIDRHKFEVAHADGIEAFTRDVTERTNRKTAALGQMLWRALIPCSSTFDPASDSGTHVMTAPLEEVLRLDRVTLEQADMACYKISERHNRSCYGIRNKLIAARALLAHGLIKKGVSKALGRPDLDAEAAITLALLNLQVQLQKLGEVLWAPLPYISTFEHSCLPNCELDGWGHGSHQFSHGKLIRTTRAVGAGERLTVAVLEPSLAFEVMPAYILSHKYWDCSCLRCKHLRRRRRTVDCKRALPDCDKTEAIRQWEAQGRVKVCSSAARGRYVVAACDLPCDTPVLCTPVVSVLFNPRVCPGCQQRLQRRSYRACAVCNVVRFCNAECEAAHQAVHKRECTYLRDHKAVYDVVDDGWCDSPRSDTSLELNDPDMAKARCVQNASRLAWRLHALRGGAPGSSAAPATSCKAAASGDGDGKTEGEGMCTRVDMENDLPCGHGVQSDAGALDDVTVVPGADDITGMHVNMHHVTACSPHLLASKEKLFADAMTAPGLFPPGFTRDGLARLALQTDSCAFEAPHGGTGVFPMAALFNHECRATLERKIVRKHGHLHMVLTTNSDVAAGEQLTVSYGIDPPFLFEFFGFVCVCYRCRRRVAAVRGCAGYISDGDADDEEEQLSGGVGFYTVGYCEGM